MSDRQSRIFAQLVLEDGLPGRDPGEALAAADWFLEQGDLPLAASSYDRAYGLDPRNEMVAGLRADVLGQLATVSHGIRFRYIPGGTFLMGSEDGDEDERPVNPVRLGEYWISETCITWAEYCDLMGWRPPPDGHPEDASREDRSYLFQENKIRRQYCGMKHGQEEDSAQPGDSRDDPRRPWDWSVKPMVAVSWESATELCTRLTNATLQFSLPTEAEWEKAARGGLIGARYSWGNSPPDRMLCDFDRMGRFAIDPPRLHPANGYGLYGMCGGVWEWTSSFYDALAYTPGAPEIALPAPTAPAVRRSRGDDGGPQHVLRGGSWADCGAACTVSFRNCRTSALWRDRCWGGHFTPNIGFRLCVRRTQGSAPSPP